MRFRRPLPVSAGLLFASVSILSGIAVAQEQNVQLQRDGLVYSIGSVQQVINRSAVIDLGDVHTIKPDEKLAVIRRENSHFRPIGFLTVAETYPTTSISNPGREFHPEVGDVVIVVREFWQLSPPDQQRREFLELQISKNSGTNSYSTRLRSDAARALLSYSKNHPKWEKRRNRILGFLNGVSFENGGEKSIEDVLRQIDLLREDYRRGRNSIAIVGAKWNAVMNVLFGPTAKSQHAASQVGDADEEDQGFEDEGPSHRDIARKVDDRLFDRTTEERHILKYIVAMGLETSPRQLDLWVLRQATQSQFRQLASEDVVLDEIRKIIRDFRD